MVSTIDSNSNPRHRRNNYKNDDDENDEDYCCNDILAKIDNEPDHICLLENDVVFKRKLEIG